MFNEGNTTYSYEHFIRAFTFSDFFEGTEKMITFDNQTFEGDDFNIIYNN